MCGIVGYLGEKPAAPLLLEGLERLSYRGYDSAGIAVMDANQKISLCKTKGKVDRLKQKAEENELCGVCGIGHTRWATHGEPTDTNAHPHTDVHGGIAVVHNGIIENHAQLKTYLQQQGVVFVSQTDTEVIAHLLHVLYNGNMKSTLRHAMGMLKGSYALAILCDKEPQRIFCARNDSPLVIGYEAGEGFIASDVPALIGHTRNVLFLDDGETAVVTPQGIEVYNACGMLQEKPFQQITWKLDDAQKNGYAHYMLKEIYEQPEALRKTASPRLEIPDGGWLPVCDELAKRIGKVTIAACGTAYHAAVLGAQMMETIARIPSCAQIASEYRYANPIVSKDELFIAVSQSGETADTLAALRKAKENGMKVMAVCNVVGSSIAREAGEENTLYTYAGPEIAVASTKAYLTQTELLLLVAVALACKRGILTEADAKEMADRLKRLPQKAEETLAVFEQVQRLADHLYQKKHVFFVGRGMDWALAMEASLKLKEVSYIPSEAYAAGELKHGPLALLQEGQLVIGIITQASLMEKTLNNLQEAASRGAQIVLFCTQDTAETIGDRFLRRIVVPQEEGFLSVLLTAIPLQMFAYCMAVARGCDVDQPRNLAKSVTVE